MGMVARARALPHDRRSRIAESRLPAVRPSDRRGRFLSVSAGYLHSRPGPLVAVTYYGRDSHEQTPRRPTTKSARNPPPTGGGATGHTHHVHTGEGRLNEHHATEETTSR